MTLTQRLLTKIIWVKKFYFEKKLWKSTCFRQRFNSKIINAFLSDRYVKTYKTSSLNVMLREY